MNNIKLSKLNNTIKNNIIINEQINFCTLSHNNINGTKLNILDITKYINIENILSKYSLLGNFILNNEQIGEIKYIGNKDIVVKIIYSGCIIDSLIDGIAVFYNLGGNNEYTKIENFESNNIPNLYNETIVNIIPNTLIKLQIKSANTNVNIFALKLQIFNV